MNYQSVNGAGRVQPLTQYVQKTGNNFETTKRKGKEGEAIVHSWLQRSFGYHLIDISKVSEYQMAGIDNLLVDVSEIPKYQKIGIDCLLYHLDGSEISLEIKTDRKSVETANLFFELESGGNPTWGWKSKADYFVFLIPNQVILFIEPWKFRQLVWRLRETLPEKTVGENTTGVAVSLADVYQIARYHFPLRLQAS